MGVGTVAVMSIKAPDALIKSLQHLSDNIGQIAEEAVQTGAGILADNVRTRLEGNLSGSKHSTGDLLDSLGVTPVRTSDKGVVDAKVGFGGYDRKGVPNIIKARVMESGSTRQAKRPFFRPAVRYTRKIIPAEMQRVIDAGIRKYVKE